jgi:hydroxyacylglutathione hydrolase
VPGCCLSQLSYLIGDESTGRAVVVDPHRDVSVYTGDAAANQLRIERVIETHCHADFLSGHLELAVTGAVICYGQGVRTDFEAEHLADGQRLDLGQVQLEIRATPGHTPESISIVVYEHPATRCLMAYSPVTRCSSGDVGRPDLLSASGLTPTSMAGQLYRSLWDKLLTLPTPPGYSPRTGQEFVAAVTEGQPVTPPYFSFDARRNLQTRPLLDEHHPPPDVAARPARTAGERRGGAGHP